MACDRRCFNELGEDDGTECRYCDGADNEPSADVTNDLKGKARKFISSPRFFAPTEAVELIRNLLQALDAAEREERERCARICRESRRTVSMVASSKECAAYNCACGDIEIAIRREGGKG